MHFVMFRYSLIVFLVSVGTVISFQFVNAWGAGIITIFYIPKTVPEDLNIILGRHVVVVTSKCFLSSNGIQILDHTQIFCLDVLFLSGFYGASF